MNFVKVGDRFVNLSQITHVKPEAIPGDETEQRIRVYFAAGYDFEGEPYQYGESFYGDEAQALLHFLCERSVDIEDIYTKSKQPFDLHAELQEGRKGHHGWRPR